MQLVILYAFWRVCLFVGRLAGALIVLPFTVTTVVLLYLGLGGPSGRGQIRNVVRHSGTVGLVALLTAQFFAAGGYIPPIVYTYLEGIREGGRRLIAREAHARALVERNGYALPDTAGAVALSERPSVPRARVTRDR